MAWRTLSTYWLVGLGLAFPYVTAAQARLNRCLDAAGHTVYTDLACEAVQAVPKSISPTHDPATGAARGCAADVQELQRRLRQAIQTGDTNALAASYHWPGLGGRQARVVLRRLERLAATAQDTRLDDDSGVVAFDAHPGDSTTSASFELIHHAGCWWIAD